MWDEHTAFHVTMASSDPVVVQVPFGAKENTERGGVDFFMFLDEENQVKWDFY